jgi:hypothetical protein
LVLSCPTGNLREDTLTTIVLKVLHCQFSGHSSPAITSVITFNIMNILMFPGGSYRRFIPAVISAFAQLIGRLSCGVSYSAVKNMILFSAISSFLLKFSS